MAADESIVNNNENSKMRSSNSRLNELDGRSWLRYSISVWNISKTTEEAKLKHPAMFPLELCSRLIQIYTKKGDVIMDPFLGSGSTLVAARDLERKGIGFELNPEYAKLARQRLSQQKLVKLSYDNCQVICADSSDMLEYIKPNSVDLVVTSPPYWIIHKRDRTADYKEPRPYSNLQNDIGNIPSYDLFLEQLKDIFRRVYVVLKPGKRCIIVVMDIRQGSQFIPFHMDTCDILKDVGYVLEDIIIWNREKEYNNLRPLGYPYAFIVNKIHEYVLIFRKNHSTQPQFNE